MQTYFPQTPSLGCLCSYEGWNKTGTLVVSNQQQIVDALNTIGSKTDYAVVIDLENRKGIITLKEVAAFVQSFISQYQNANQSVRITLWLFGSLCTSCSFSGTQRTATNTKFCNGHQVF